MIIWYTRPSFHNNSDVHRHSHTHTTHRPVFERSPTEIQVVSSVLAVQQKKADGNVDSLS